MGLVGVWANIRVPPKRQERALIAVQVGLVLPKLEVLGHIGKGVLVAHALEDLRCVRHCRRVHNVLGARLLLLLLLRRRATLVLL